MDLIKPLNQNVGLQAVAVSQAPAADSNFLAVKKSLNIRGYGFAHKSFDARATQVPHRRQRLYMAGHACNGNDDSDDLHTESVLKFEDGFSSRMHRCMASILDAAQESLNVPLDFSLFDGSDADPQAFCARWYPEWSTDITRGTGEGMNNKWYDKHMQYWDAVPPEAASAAARVLHQNYSVQRLTSREKDLLTFLYANHMDDDDMIAKIWDIKTQACKVRVNERVWDIQQNMGRVPTCMGSIPCSLPMGMPWLQSMKRPVVGAESLMLQGGDPHFLPALREGAWSSKFLQNLAGNAFNVPCFSAWLLSIFAAA